MPIAIADSRIRTNAPPRIAATTAANAAPRNTEPIRPTCMFASQSGSVGSCVSLIDVGIVVSAAVYAPMPMNATCPNEMIPVSPMNTWNPSTRIASR